MGFLYVGAFFFLYCLFFAIPTLHEILQTTAPGPEQEHLAQQAVRTAIRPKLPLALLAAMITTALGTYAGVLPGTKRVDS